MSRLRVAACVLLALGGCGDRSHEVMRGLDTSGRRVEPGTGDAGAMGSPDGDAAAGPGARSDTPGGGAVDAPDHDRLRALAPVRFVDATAEAGLEYTQAEVGTQLGCDVVASKCPYSGIHMSGGAAVGDFDDDGWPDLFVTRLDQPPILYRNLGDGRFADVSEAAGVGFGEGTNGAAFADIDNDGDQDLYVTSVFATRYYLFVNLGDGTFSEQAIQRGAAVETAYPHRGFSVAFGDYDRDGYLDLHTTEWVQPASNYEGPSHARLLRNLGADHPGFFEDTTESAGVDLLAGVRSSRTTFSSSFTDLDDDGWPELAVVGDFSTSRLFWNEGGGTFVDGTLFSGVGGDQNGMGSALGDYDGDGRIDWFISSIYDPEDRCADNDDCGWGTTGNRLYRNLGERRFGDVTDEAGVRDGSWGWGASFFDYDNDGDLDLTHTNGVDFPNPESSPFVADRHRLWRNEGVGRFREVATEVGLDVVDDGKGLVVFDYDGDGDLDLFVANHESGPRLFRNEGGNENGFLRVVLRDTRGNRDGVGARVTLQRVRHEPPQVREIRADGAFLGESERVAHFGLGGYGGKLHRLVVQWPDGETTELEDLEPDQTLRVER